MVFTYGVYCYQSIPSYICGIYNQWKTFSHRSLYGSIEHVIGQVRLLQPSTSISIMEVLSLPLCHCYGRPKRSHVVMAAKKNLHGNPGVRGSERGRVWMRKEREVRWCASRDVQMYKWGGVLYTYTCVYVHEYLWRVKYTCMKRAE